MLKFFSRSTPRRAGAILCTIVFSIAFFPLAQTALNEAGISTISTAAAAAPADCFVTVVGEPVFVGGVDCNGVNEKGGSISNPGGGTGTGPPPCQIGEAPWAYPLDPSTDPPTSKSESVLIESTGGSGGPGTENYVQAAIDTITPWSQWNTYSPTAATGGQNSASWFWNLAMPDMLAKALQIWKDPGGSSYLNIEPPTQRTADLTARALYLNSDLGLIGGSLTFSGTPPDNANAVSLFPYAPAIGSGADALVPGGALVGNLLSTIDAAVDSMYGIGGFNLSYYLYKNYPQQPSWTQTFASAQSDVWGSSFLPVYVEIIGSDGSSVPSPSNTTIAISGQSINVWTRGDLSQLGADMGNGYNANLTSDSTWQAIAIFNGYSQNYTSIAQVISAFNQVVAANLKVTWHTTDTDARGVSTPIGVAWYPALASGGCGTLPDLSFFGISLQHDTNATCNIASVGSNAAYLSTMDASIGTNPQSGQPAYDYDACWLVWTTQRIPPPSITQAAWNTAVSKAMTPIQLVPASSALLVNQPVTISVAGSQLNPNGSLGISHGYHLSIASPFGISDYGSADFVLTQVGISLTLGNISLGVYLPRDASKPEEGYSFTFPGFSATPQSLMQTAYCSAATSAADLMARCGIGFKLDTYGNVQPYFHISVHTWWDGIVQAKIPSMTWYCGLFLTSAFAAGKPYCSTSSWSAADYVNWQSTWGFNTAPLYIDASGNLVSATSAPLSWSAAEAKYGTATPYDFGRIGSPMLDVSHAVNTNGTITRAATGAGFDISVDQVEVQGNGGSFAPPTLGPNPPLPTPTPAPTAVPTAAPTAKPTPTPVPTKSVTECTFSLNASLRTGPGTSYSSPGRLPSNATVTVEATPYTGSNWSGLGGTCGYSGATTAWYRITAPPQYAGDYVYAGAFKP